MAFVASYIKYVDYNMLHKRIGHPTVHSLNQTMKRLDATFTINKQVKPSFCEACQLDKCHMQYFPSVETSTTQPLELLHANLQWPAPIQSSQGYHYYFSILDDYTRLTWIFPLTDTSQTLSIFISFKAMTKNNLNKKKNQMHINRLEG